jgi:hypothetical protein
MQTRSKTGKSKTTYKPNYDKVFKVNKEFDPWATDEAIEDERSEMQIEVETCLSTLSDAGIKLCSDCNKKIKDYLSLKIKPLKVNRWTQYYEEKFAEEKTKSTNKKF